MRVKTRSGQWLTIPDDQIVRQEKRITRHETYYVVYCQTCELQAAEQLHGVKLDVVDLRRQPARDSTLEASAGSLPSYPKERDIPRAEDCPSAGGAVTASKQLDPHSADRVKGETFFSHKSDSGLVIKSPQGKVIHETKVSDMYKRR